MAGELGNNPAILNREFDSELRSSNLVIFMINYKSCPTGFAVSMVICIHQCVPSMYR